MRLLESKGFITLQEVHDIARHYGRKQSTAERAMRDKRVIAKKNDKNHVVGYWWASTKPIDDDFDDRYAAITAETRARAQQAKQRALL